MAMRKRKPTVVPVPVVTLEGEVASATLPAGATAHMPVSVLFERLHPSGFDSAGTVLPDGVKALVPARDGAILVHQTPPRVYDFRWIAPDSETPYGPEAKYRQVRIALPYLIVLASFQNGRGDLMQLGNRNECFFSNQPLDRQGFETPLCYPALLNCSKFPESDENPLAWICTQHLRPRDFVSAKSLQSRLHTGLSALLRHLLESAFNLSSDENEIASWFSETVKAHVDPRIASVESWEEATRDDPLFVLDVPWLPTGRTLGSIAERMAGGASTGNSTTNSSHDIARVIFNAGVKG